MNGGDSTTVTVTNLGGAPSPLPDRDGVVTSTLAEPTSLSSSVQPSPDAECIDDEPRSSPKRRRGCDDEAQPTRESNQVAAEAAKPTGPAAGASTSAAPVDPPQPAGGPTAAPVSTPSSGSTPDYGLFVEDHKVELQRVQIDVLLLDLCVDVRVRQVFAVSKPAKRKLGASDDGTTDNEAGPRLAFAFPIDDVKAGVYHFSARLGPDQVITVKVVEKDHGDDAAKKPTGLRNRALAQQQASLMTAKRDRFEVDLGRHRLPFADHATEPEGRRELQVVQVEVELRYMMEIMLARSSLFRIETAEDKAKVDAQRAEQGNRFKFVFPALFSSPHFCATESSLALHVDVEAASPILSLESLTHPQLAMTLDGGDGGLSASGDLRLARACLDKDFILLVAVEEPHQPRGWKMSLPLPVDTDDHQQPAEDVSAVMLALCPDVSSTASEPTLGTSGDAEVSPQQEIIFIVDQSGSMSGSPMESLKECLNIVIRSLPPATTLFNLVGFGSSYKILFTDEHGRPKGQALNQETFDQVTNYIRSMGADMGGTNILSALVAVLEGRHQPADSSSYLYLLKRDSGAPPMLSAAGNSSTLPPLPPPTCPRQLFILSDGMMDNKREDILDILRKHSTNTTAFTFGIGGTADVECIKAMARAMRGSAEFISHKQGPDEAQHDVDQGTNDMEQEAEEEEELPKEWLCPITGQLMQDPAVTSCGHLFDRTAIHQWLTKESLTTGRFCPMCHNPLSLREVFPCYPIKSAIEEHLSKRKKSSAAAGSSTKNGDRIAAAAALGQPYQAPFQPPPLFEGDTLVVYALMPSTTACDSAQVTARGPRGESIKERVVLRTPTSQVSTLLHRLAVRALIKDYQQDNSVWHYRFARVKDELKRPGAAMSVQHYARAEMTKLALLYSVVSPPSYAPTSPSYSPTSPSWEPRADPQGTADWMDGVSGLPFPITTSGSFLSPPHKPSSPLFAHVAKLQPCVAGLLTHLTQLQPNIASLLTHLTSLLAHITFLFAHLAQLQSNIAVVLAHVAVLLAHIAGLYADGAHEPQPDSERLRRGSGQRAPERDPNLPVSVVDSALGELTLSTAALFNRIVSTQQFQGWWSVRDLVPSCFSEQDVSLLVAVLHEAWRSLLSERTMWASEQGKEKLEDEEDKALPASRDKTKDWPRIAVTVLVLLELESPAFEARFVVWEPLAIRARAWLRAALGLPSSADLLRLIASVRSTAP
ncbi:Ubox domain containing protein [Acanthamoeba castellanii str. Neff]|uniref:Ubox domain containing protein n=1 Tax=Acanthamoeba castellanii (strain ATCC 30010 / Neff) TaxID=1257118 RepID=L8GVS9_ACACF|nr:Ubox domain containing protein [Acanthamoeba castellanii str. Neff]ELR17090.1 Ubox domain containing protein [Acanthamoeba castellanii str. Neff]